MLEESASALSSSIWTAMNSWFTPTVLFVLLNVVIGTIAFTSTLATPKQHNNTQQQDYTQHPNIARSPSLLQRFKSINFHTHFRSAEVDHNDEPGPDSETLLNAGHAHQAQNLEPQSSHYFFQENFQSPQPHAHYFFQHNPQDTQAHFGLEEKKSESYDIHQAYEKKVEDLNVQSQEDEDYSRVTGVHFSRTKSDTEPASGQVPAKLPTKMRKSASLKSAFGHFKEEDIVEERRPATTRETGLNAKVTDGDEEVDAKADDFINRFKQQLKLQRLDSIVRYRDMIGRASGERN